MDADLSHHVSMLLKLASIYTMYLPIHFSMYKVSCTLETLLFSAQVYPRIHQEAEGGQL